MTFIKKSGTGNKQTAAKKAPLSARLSALLDTEQTSDAQYLAAKGRRPHHAKEQLRGGEQKRKAGSPAAKRPRKAA